MLVVSEELVQGRHALSLVQDHQQNVLLAVYIAAPHAQGASLRHGGTKREDLEET